MSAEARRGLVLSVESGRFTVESGDNTFFCRSGTRVRKSEGRLVAGDRVLFSVGETGEGFITDIEPRKNRLTRPPAANIDLLAIAVAPREPQPYLYNIDLLTVIAQKHGIECAIILTKCDLGGGERILDIYSRTPYPVIATGTGEGSGIVQAKDLLLLCSDGLTNMVPVEQIEQLLKLCRQLEKLDINQLKEKLVSITNTVEKAMTAKDKVAKTVTTITEKVTGFLGSVSKFFAGLFNK